MIIYDHHVIGVNTVRGCETSKPEEVKSFESCGRIGCNKVIYPRDRIQCVACSSDDDYCVQPTADLLFPCKNYDENDKCFTYAIGEFSFSNS